MVYRIQDVAHHVKAVKDNLLIRLGTCLRVAAMNGSHMSMATA